MLRGKRYKRGKSGLMAFIGISRAGDECEMSEYLSIPRRVLKSRTDSEAGEPVDQVTLNRDPPIQIDLTPGVLKGLQP